MVYTLRFFPSKCSLFHNSNVFGSCIIHILYTGCVKIKKIIPAPVSRIQVHFRYVNPLTPNDQYRGRTAPLTAKFAFYIFIKQI